ncbi:hypothetical protein WMY93_013937 [Mugilogobius chulae]|uniref:Reverse transcriptase n=1 Tax=Mugilogobius chulae TaxID=88201 RepID=A0AAW0PDR8_9GOBI
MRKGLHSSGSELRGPLYANGGCGTAFIHPVVSPAARSTDTEDVERPSFIRFNDSKVARAGIEVRTGRKWKAHDAVAQAEARLKHSELTGTLAHGRAGFGSNTKPIYSKTRGKERRKLIQDEVRAEVEEARGSKIVAMGQQGAWSRWEHASNRRISWADLWKFEPHRIKFLIQSVYDVLPTPSNLFRWGLADTPQCPLCQKAGSLEHILSCCPRALADGRYRWRHDQVLKAIADAITSGIISSKHQQPTKLQITFVRAGEKPHQRREKGGALLASARDWQLKVDLGKQLKFPESIAETTLRPDMVLLSETTRQVLLLELTVPWEDRIEEAFERKRAKYRELVNQCRSQGWQARCNPIEVGCRGFAGQGVRKSRAASVE